MFSSTLMTKTTTMDDIKHQQPMAFLWFSYKVVPPSYKLVYNPYYITIGISWYIYHKPKLLDL